MDASYAPGDAALAVAGPTGWQIAPVEPPEPGEPGLVVDSPDGPAVFRARAVEKDRPAFAVASPGGRPAAVWTAQDDNDGEGDDNPEIGGGDCWGAHALCSRIYCDVLLKRIFYVMFSGFPDDCSGGPFNGLYAVEWVGDCRWIGSALGWDMELYFLSSTGQVAWVLNWWCADQAGVAHSTYTDPRDPRRADMVIVGVPCGEIGSAAIVIL